MSQKVLHDDLVAGGRSFHQRSESTHRLPAWGPRSDKTLAMATPPPSPRPRHRAWSLLFQRQSTSRLCSFTAVSTCCDLSLHLTTAKSSYRPSLLTDSEHLLSTSPDTPPCRSGPSWNPLGTPGLRTDAALPYVPGACLCLTQS